MMLQRMIAILLLLGPALAIAQVKVPLIARTHHEFGSMLATNTSMTTLSVNRVQYWGVGRKLKHFKFGLGGRLTAAFGKNGNDYITAPAILTSGKTGPGVFFADQINQNIDTLTLQRTTNFILNAYLALSYDFSSRWAAEFNIDLAGISFGPQTSGILYFKEGKSITPFAGDVREIYTDARPSTYNVLLISDNDRGSLNSEFFVSYRVRKNAKIRVGASFLFNEYRVKSAVQYTNSIGTFVDTDRYRLKSLMFTAGAIVLLKNIKHVKKTQSAS